MQGIVVTLTAGAATGDLKQIYGDGIVAGVAFPGNTGGQVRRPQAGFITSAQIQTDLTNAGVLELWDIDGTDGGADVSSSDVITDAELLAAVAKGKARLIMSQNFLATPQTPINIAARTFMRGLAARFVGTTGTCKLNLAASDGLGVLIDYIK